MYSFENKFFPTMAVLQRQHMGTVGCWTFFVDCSACLSAIFCLFLGSRPAVHHRLLCGTLQNKWTMKIT